ncbi:toxin-antitoxin system YwqK family antitoxin [Tamlana crocina]|uniref:Toxin-antitoxin system YwqK family antitoxin n=1 Tax=Tamlana crocina TaxID=393006 RepID=A0ABX1D6C0_9FLAO|nr:hypothetical protein [Tamlana crocina]NJX13913.1 hypothetical protein [Tamlana crocina]
MPKKFVLISTLVSLFVLSCKKDQQTDNNNFKLVERNSYFVDSYNNISIYRSNEDRKPLNGYYIVGDKFKKWEEFNVKNGILNGTYIVFHSNGEIFSQSNYLNGKLHGEEKKYDLAGHLSKVNTYKHGVLYGKSISYFDNGNIKSESKIKDEKVIESVSFDLIGNIESQMFIKEGRSITQTIKNGKVFSEQISSNYDDFEAVKFYNPDGSLKMFLRMLEDGDTAYLIELDKNNEEMKRINLKENPQEIFKYQEYLKAF